MKLENISINQGGQPIVQSISFEIAEKEIIALMGPSGSGKTTLLKAIAGLQKVSSGKIKRRNGTGKIGYAFQEPRLFPHMTVMDNLSFGLRVQGLTKKQRNEKVLQFLHVFQLQGLERRYPHQLSGGQKQRVSLGRSLILEPDLLLLDEPFSSLDESLRLELTGWLYQLQREKGFSILWVTHSLEEAFSVSDRMGVMLDGRLQQIGNPLDVYQHPNSEKLANFFMLPNRFSSLIWKRIFPFIHIRDEMGWIPSNLIIINGSESSGGLVMNGVIRRVKYEKNGSILLIEACGEEWQVFINVENRASQEGEKVKIVIPYEKIIWYPR